MNEERSSFFLRERGIGFWFGVGILLAGIILFLSAIRVLQFSFRDIFSPLVALTGFVIALQAFTDSRRDEHGKLISGTLIFFLGIFLLLSHFEIIATPSGMGLGVTLVGIGLALAVDVIYDLSIKLLITGVVLIALGALILFGIFSFSFARATALLWHWWPLALIAIGLLIFLRRR